jgi:hypothetical protein
MKDVSARGKQAAAAPPYDTQRNAVAARKNDTRGAAWEAAEVNRAEGDPLESDRRHWRHHAMQRVLDDAPEQQFLCEGIERGEGDRYQRERPHRDLTEKVNGGRHARGCGICGGRPNGESKRCRGRGSGGQKPRLTVGAATSQPGAALVRCSRKHDSECEKGRQRPGPLGATTARRPARAPYRARGRASAQSGVAAASSRPPNTVAAAAAFATVDICGRSPPKPTATVAATTSPPSARPAVGGAGIPVTSRPARRGRSRR